MPTATEELNHYLTVPPANLDPQHTGNPISIAHAALQSLRDAGDEHLLFLRVILEQQATEELLFHCIIGCRQVVLWKWTQHYSVHFIQKLRSCFLVMGHQHTTTRTCQMALYATAVAFWKRGWNDDTTGSSPASPSPQEQALWAQFPQSAAVPIIDTPSDLFVALETQLQQDTIPACLFLEALVTEFGSKSSTVNYHMSLEFHKNAHQSYETTGPLFTSLRLAITTLGRLSQQQHSSGTDQQPQQQILQSVIKVLSAVLSWEWGVAAWNDGPVTVSSSLVRVPVEWRDYVIQPDLCTFLFQSSPLLPESREVLLLLASITGLIYASPRDRESFCQCLCDGSLQLLQHFTTTTHDESSSSGVMDTLQIVSKLIVNFRLSILLSVPSFSTLLQVLAATGKRALEDQVSECQKARGDIESMENFEWREEVIALVLECATWLCEDPCLQEFSSSDKQKVHTTQRSLACMLGPLFVGFVHCRTQMASLEERHLHGADVEEEHEEILEMKVGEEMESIAAIGRLDLSSALSCLSELFGNTMYRLKSLWEQSSSDVTAEAVALLEETRLLVAYITHLLTDSDEGESPCIPLAILACCRDDEMTHLSRAVEMLMELADFHRQRLSMNPSNPLLSPLLAKAFLGFLKRWIPAYVDPLDLGPSDTNTPLVKNWVEKAQPTLHLCLSLCAGYQCYWPQETIVQEAVGQFMLKLAKRDGKFRRYILASSVIQELARFHHLTAGVPHTMPPNALQARFQEPNGPVWGFFRLSYTDRARVLTFLLIVWSDSANGETNMSSALKSVHDAFSHFTSALSQKVVQAEDIQARETACSCVELFCAVAQGSEMVRPERLAAFLTPYLSQLSGLMEFYSQDLIVCESLLRFFRDYTANFLVYLDKTQSMVLFQACAELLKSYSNCHCSNRVVEKRTSIEVKAEEGQTYSDILCALQLLVNISTKDFLDMCSTQKDGVPSSQVTELVFFGLQQIMPLMTRGLLQYPVLCKHFFELIATVIDSYPEKVCSLPYETFSQFLESLLFGMSYHESDVAKGSLRGLASVLREHSKTGALLRYLPHRSDLLGYCSKRLLSDLVFQAAVTDRVEATSTTLLLVLASDLSQFTSAVQELLHQVHDPSHRSRLEVAFSKLIQPSIVSQSKKDGYEGRNARLRFKTLFAEFLKEVHAFMVVR